MLRVVRFTSRKLHCFGGDGTVGGVDNFVTLVSQRRRETRLLKLNHAAIRLILAKPIESYNRLFKREDFARVELVDTLSAPRSAG
jgi:hypothetical protein